MRMMERENMGVAAGAAGGSPSQDDTVVPRHARQIGVESDIKMVAKDDVDACRGCCGQKECRKHKCK